MNIRKSEHYNNLLGKLTKANLSDDNEAVVMTLDLLCNHIENIAPILKKTPIQMLKDIDVNIIEELSEISENTNSSRYFQLVGKYSNLVPDRKYGIASVMKENDIDEGKILDATGLVWCRADHTFKQFIFKPMTLNTDKLERLLMSNGNHRYCLLSDLVNAHPILDSYDDIKHLSVSFEIMEDKNVGGYFSHSKNEIAININAINYCKERLGSDYAYDQVLSIISHETQHFVQRSEPSWSTGNSLSGMTPEVVNNMIDVEFRRFKSLFPDAHDEVRIREQKIQDIAKEHDLDDIYDALSVISEDELDSLNDYKHFHSDSEAFYSRIMSQKIDLEESVDLKLFNKRQWNTNTTGEVYARFCADAHKAISNDVARNGVSEKAAFFNFFKQQTARGNHIHNGYAVTDKSPEKTRSSLGFIDFYENGQTVVSLIKSKANISTWTHEVLGHYVYENLLKAAELKDAPEWIEEALYKINTLSLWNVTSKDARHEIFANLAELTLARYSASTPAHIKAVSRLIDNEVKGVLDFEKSYSSEGYYVNSVFVQSDFIDAFSALTKPYRADLEL